MKPEQNNMEDLFRSAFEDASLEPPHKEKMWGMIANAIPKPPIPIYKMAWFRVSGIAASIALLLGVFYFLNDKPTPISYTDETGKPAIVENTQKNTENIKKDKKNEVISAIPNPAEKQKSSEQIENQLSTAKDNLPQNTESKLIEKNENLATSLKKVSKSQENAKENVVNNEAVPAEKKIAEKEISTQKDKNPAIIASNTEEKAAEKIVFEVQEIFVLTPEIAFPQALLQPPTIQLVVVSKVEVAPEKVKIENPYWVGFGGFYNAYKPNFQFNAPDLPSPFVRSINDVSRFPQNMNVAKSMRDSITINPALSVNIDFGKLIAKNLFIRSGINFSSVRYSINSTVVDKSANVALASVILTPNTVENMTASLHIPVQFGYQSNGKGLNYFVSGGFSTDILLNNSLTNTYSPAVYDFGTYKTLNISALGSAGLLYNIAPRFSALIEVNYRRSLTSVYDSPHLQSRPQWIGFGIGLRQKF